MPSQSLSSDRYPQPTPPSFYTGHDAIWYGIALWAVWFDQQVSTQPCQSLAFLAWFLTPGDRELLRSVESVLKDLPALFCSLAPEGSFPVYRLNFRGAHIRIIAWFGLEGTFTGHLVQPPAMGRDIFHQIRLLRAPSNLALNVSRDGASTTSLGDLLQGFTTLTFQTITPCPIATGRAKKPVPIFLISPLEVLKGHDKVSLEPSLLQAEHPQLSQPVFIGEVLQPSDHFCGLLWTCSNSSMSFLC
ncbi:hypothetical protein QYF61_016614 [Mycteria americana]|uniref:Uncharacterized protein n=1 Tax=Mycteria americana TaxID=33587 RepID=A0AAN7S552_MYCAM|nr:hypothetical protein QYF61_016614 [Mycteria americana]